MHIPPLAVPSLTAAVNEVACFWSVSETCPETALSTPRLVNNFATTIFCGLGNMAETSYTWVAVNCPPAGTGVISVRVVPSPQSIDILSGLLGAVCAPVTVPVTLTSCPHFGKLPSGEVGSRVKVIEAGVENDHE